MDAAFDYRIGGRGHKAQLPQSNSSIALQFTAAQSLSTTVILPMTLLWRVMGSSTKASMQIS